MTHDSARYLVLTLCVGLCGPSLLGADDFSSDIVIELLTLDESPVIEGDTVSGTLTGKVTIRNSMMQHAQFYKNFRVISTHEVGHMIDSSDWVRTFSVDTSEFYDGENLISAHVHPMNVPGQPYIADFSVQAFKIVAENDNPAPTGDVRLPTLTIDPSMMLLLDSTLLGSKSVYTDYEAVTVSDDDGRMTQA